MKLIRQLTLCLMDLEIKINLLYGEESVNQPSVFHAELLVDYAVNTDLWLGVTVQLKFFLFDGGQIEKTLVVTSISTADYAKEHKALVSLILQSPLGLLHYASRPRVFVNQNKLTVIKHVLTENHLFKPQQCHFHLSKSYQAVPMIMQLYHESNFSFIERLVAEEKLFYWLDGLDVHISDQELFCPMSSTEYIYNPDDGLIYRFWSEQMRNRALFHVHSYLPMINPGHCLVLDKKEYIVIAIKHYVKPSKALNHDVLPYWNEMTLQLRSDAKLVPDKPQFQVPWCFQATVESPTAAATLDSRGCYQVKFFFDQEAESQSPHSAFIPRLQCYGDDKQDGVAIGVHFPLYDGTEVLINCIEGDLYQPIILGALATSNHPSIVNNICPNQNVVATANNCGLVLNDQAQRSTLYTPINHLMLDQQQQAIELLTEQGDIKLYSKQNTVLAHGAEAATQVNGQMVVVADKTALLTQAAENLSLQSAGNVNVVAGHDVMMQADTMQLNALGQLIVSATTIKQLLQQGQQIWQVKNSLVMKGKKLDIKSEHLIVLSCVNSAIEIRPDKISFFSKVIEIETEECRIQANHSNFNDQLCQEFKAATAKPLVDLKVLPVIKDDQDLLILDCHWSHAEARIDDEIYAHCFVKNIDCHRQGELIVYCQDHVFVARKPFCIADVREHVSAQHANLQIPWKVSESQQSQQLACQDKVFYYFDVDIDGVENQTTSTPLQILMDLNINVSYQCVANMPNQSTVMVVAPNKRSSLAFVRNDKAVAKDILLGKLELSLAILQADKSYKQQLVYSDQQKQPWLNVQLKLPVNLKTQSTTLRSILPPVFIRFDDRDEWLPTSATLLHANVVSDLKKSCRNQPISVTLFIHGFDVEPGKLGQCIDSVQHEELWGWLNRKAHLQADDGLVVNFSDVDASVYQEFKTVQQRFAMVKDQSDFLERYNINGSGDCSWVLAIEHWLNKACGLEQKGYDYYQRMIGVCWPAMPDTSFDYIAVTRRIRTIGQKTASLIKQLLNSGFEVNVVAHSLGCGVLMQALNYLGQDKSCDKKVSHCFLWDAAVPSNIFSTCNYDLQRDKACVQLLMERDHWYVPYAKDAATKFIVLHSENDNILGPIPEKQTAGENQFYVNSKKPFLSELVPAVLLTYLGLDSIYDIAMILNVPITHMMDQSYFADIYKQWWRRYHPIKDKKGRFYPDSLQKRIAQLSDQEFQTAKNGIWDHYQKNKEIIHRYIDAARRACMDTDITGYQDVEFLVDHPMLVEDYFIFNLSPSNSSADGALSPQLNPGASRQSYDFYYGLYVKLPILISSVFFDNTICYPRALGYKGVDASDPATQQLLSEGKIEQVDQSDCLFSHSGMKNPSRDVFEKIYRRAIWRGQSEFHFGGYGR